MPKKLKDKTCYGYFIIYTSRPSEVNVPGTSVLSAHLNQVMLEPWYNRKGWSAASGVSKTQLLLLLVYFPLLRANKLTLGSFQLSDPMTHTEALRATLCSG